MNQKYKFIRDPIIMGEVYHVDHRIPISKGGLHSQENLQVMRAIDNILKSNNL